MPRCRSLFELAEDQVEDLDAAVTVGALSALGIKCTSWVGAESVSQIPPHVLGELTRKGVSVAPKLAGFLDGKSLKHSCLFIAHNICWKTESVLKEYVECAKS